MTSSELGPQFSADEEQMIIHRCTHAKEKLFLPKLSKLKTNDEMLDNYDFTSYVIL